MILAEDADYPAFVRVVWSQHVAEMSDLSTEHQQLLMNAVFTAESILRELLQPTKINLASLGNQVPHLHWHIIPRFDDDRHFPDPIWAAPRRAASHPLDSGLIGRLKDRLHAAMTQLASNGGN